MSRELTAQLIDTYDYVMDRLRRRLIGLTDDEYLWEPVSPCLSVRPDPEGVYRCDRGEWPETRPSTFTTIAWRLCHLADNLTEERIARFFDGPEYEPPYIGHPATADSAIAYAEDAYRWWRSNLESADEASLWTMLREQPHRNRPLVRFVLQYTEELAHHAAEVALLRDLYRATHT